jgi:NitT/TauT family transport system substrate-binding protein
MSEPIALRIRGLPVPPSIMLARTAADTRLQEAFPESNFAVWSDAAAMRSDLKAGAVDLCVIPTNLAASLHNQGIAVRLIAVTVWGILHVLTNRPEWESWDDLRGARIAIPIKGNMPDTVFGTLAARAGLDVEGAVTAKYFDSYVAAAAALSAGEVDAAVLPEPVATASIEGGSGVARMLDLQIEWGRLTGGAPRFPQAGAVAATALLQSSHGAGDIIAAAIGDALAWMDGDPDAAAALGEPYLGGLPRYVIAASLRQSRGEMKVAAEARPELEAFYRTLIARSPDLVAGGLPGDDFYWSAAV